MKIYDLLNTDELKFYKKEVKGDPSAETHFLRKLFKKKWWKVIESGFLYIKTKDMQLVSLEPNRVQKRFIDLVRRIEDQGKPVRIIVPKSRQQGISTITESIIYAKTAFDDNINSLIIADENKKATHIFEMSKLMHDKFSMDIRHEKEKSNSKELSFAGLLSKIQIDTAENKDAGRSGTFHNVHISEFGFFPHPEELMTGLNQTVPNISGTMNIIESTGNGIGNMLYDMTMRAIRGEIDYQVFFVAWFESDEYALELDEEDDNLKKEILDGVCPEYGDERYYFETYGLTLQQMKWRRSCIRNQCNGDLKIFMQEYPSCLEECFQASGNPVFSQLALQKIEEGYTRPEKYRALYIHDDTTGKGRLQKADSGNVKIWNEPEAGWQDRYLLVADTGGMWGDEKKGADFSYAAIYDRMERKICASVRGHFAATFFAKIIRYLAEYYSEALLAVEINKYASETDEHGISVLEKVKKDLDYWNLYYRKTLDKKLNKETDQLGFHMNTKTKSLIVDRLQDYVRNYVDEDIRVNDSGIIGEMKTYIVTQTKTGRTAWEAQEGCKDDRVDVFGEILYISSSMPDWSRKKEEIDYKYNDLNSALDYV